MKNITKTIIYVLFFLTISQKIYADDIKEMIKSLSNGECTTSECLTEYNIKNLTRGQCITSECLTEYNIKKSDCWTMHNQ